MLGSGETITICYVLAAGLRAVLERRWLMLRPPARARSRIAARCRANSGLLVSKSVKTDIFRGQF